MARVPIQDFLRWLQAVRLLAAPPGVGRQAIRFAGQSRWNGGRGPQRRARAALGATRLPDSALFRLGGNVRMVRAQEPVPKWRATALHRGSASAYLPCSAVQEPHPRPSSPVATSRWSGPRAFS